MKRTFWTSAQAQLESADVAPVDITVNDRAATRQAIIVALEDKGVAFTERSDWHAVPTGVAMALDWDYSMIALHHAGRSYLCGMDEFQMRRILFEHVNRKGFSDIGYHYAIGCDGIVIEARDIRLKGSGVAMYNTGVISIVLLNNYASPGEGGGLIGDVHANLDTANDFPLPQTDALLALVQALRSVFPIQVFGGHREYPGQAESGKICPGNIGMTLVHSVRQITGLGAPPAA